MNSNNPSININCDLGEGLENDHLIMSQIHSCNIACGEHAGDEKTMRSSVSLALENNVQIGAHPSYPDKENFGRVVIDMDLTELRNSLVGQIEALRNICLSEGSNLIHVKPHGALYNVCFKSRKISNLVLDSICDVNDQLILFAPYQSEISKIAVDRRMRVWYEAFADRNYNEDLSLVSRSQKNAIVDQSDVLDHVRTMVLKDQVKTVSGRLVKMKAQTFCVHGDNPQALEILHRLNAAF